jgi:hypothetical protein
MSKESSWLHHVVYGSEGGSLAALGGAAFYGKAAISAWQIADGDYSSQLLPGDSGDGGLLTSDLWRLPQFYSDLGFSQPFDFDTKHEMSCIGLQDGTFMRAGLTDNLVRFLWDEPPLIQQLTPLSCNDDIDSLGLSSDGETMFVCWKATKTPMDAPKTDWSSGIDSFLMNLLYCHGFGTLKTLSMPRSLRRPPFRLSSRISPFIVVIPYTFQAMSVRHRTRTG